MKPTITARIALALSLLTLSVTSVGSVYDNYKVRNQYAPDTYSYKFNVSDFGNGVGDVVLEKKFMQYSGDPIPVVFATPVAEGFLSCVSTQDDYPAAHLIDTPKHSYTKGFVGVTGAYFSIERWPYPDFPVRDFYFSPYVNNGLMTPQDVLQENSPATQLCNSFIPACMKGQNCVATPDAGADWVVSYDLIQLKESLE